MDVETLALVIREVPLNENDKLITLLTDKVGKITILARGVKGIRSKNAPAVQLYCFSRYELTEKNGRYLLKTAELKESFYALRDDLLRYSLAAYFAEVADTMGTENENDCELLRLVLNAYYAMCSQKEKPLLLIKGAFEVRALSVAGIMPDLTCCALCGKSAGDYGSPVSDSFLTNGGYTLLSLKEGGLICEECRSNKESGANEKMPSDSPALPDDVVPIAPGVFGAMRYVTASPISKFLSFRLGSELLVPFSETCERMLVYALEKNFDTIRFFREMLKNSDTA